MKIELAGETVELLAERGLWRPRARTLIVTDTHWGQRATARHADLSVPLGATDDVERLTRMLEATRAERLVFLGDIIHARQGRHPETLERIAAWRARHAQLAVDLVRGNHEYRAGDPPAEWRFNCRDEPFADGPFALRHTPGREPGRYVLAGHLHPKTRRRGKNGGPRKLACFRIGEASAILPAFSALAGGGGFQPAAGERVFVIEEGEVREARTA